MPVAVVTGSSGLVGSEMARFVHEKGLEVIGLDNDMRKYFFGAEASTAWNTERLKRDLKRFTHHDIDVRDQSAVFSLFEKYGGNIALVVHTAAQPSHDWAAREPVTDFTVNANGTLVLLEATRKFSSGATFIFTSTNKVYGDTPNKLPLVEMPLRWELDPRHRFAKNGIDETMTVDESKHSLFGASKVAADILVQDVAIGRPYTIYGYRGKQVRDNIHSYDLVNAFWQFFENPGTAAVYNIGGSRHSNCSILEGIRLAEEMCGKRLQYTISDNARSGDHIWYISDVSRFQKDYPAWKYRYDLGTMLSEIVAAAREREKFS